MVFDRPLFPCVSVSLLLRFMNYIKNSWMSHQSTKSIPVLPSHKGEISFKQEGYIKCTDPFRQFDPPVRTVLRGNSFRHSSYLCVRVYFGSRTNITPPNVITLSPVWVYVKESIRRHVRTDSINFLNTFFWSFPIKRFLVTLGFLVFSTWVVLFILRVQYFCKRC